MTLKATKMEKDGKEMKIYDEVYSYMYLTASRYPEGATKADKATSKKRSKKVEVVDGILHYKEKKGNSMNLRQVSSMNRLNYK